MNINEEFQLLLSEEVHNKPFKAVFLTGGPGSGKDYLLNNVLNTHGLVEIPSEKAHEYVTNPKSLHPNIEKNSINKRVKNVKELRQLLALHGRNGLIVNGTGDNHRHTNTIKNGLEKIGYDTSMIHVHADDEVSKGRNIERAKKGGRTIPEKDRKEKWDKVQTARLQHAKMFGDNYHEFDNSPDLRNAPPELVKTKKDELAIIHDNISKFVNKSDPNKDKELDSQYFGDKQENKDTPKVITPKKKLSEMFIKESVSVTITGDTVDEVNDLFEKLGKKEKEKEDKDTFSDKPDYLTLGKKTEPIGNKNEDIIITNDDMKNMFKEDYTEQKPIKKFSDLRKNIKESIDRGIEPGLSMAASGENLGRDSGEVIGKDGKVKKKITELTGDETGASIGAEKDDESKKNGIDLTTFNSNGYARKYFKTKVVK